VAGREALGASKLGRRNCQSPVEVLGSIWKSLEGLKREQKIVET